MEITELTVHELKEKLDKKELTVSEITKAYADRINEKEKDVEAFVTPLTEEAMEKAKQKGVKLLLPIDTKIGKEFKPDTESKTVAWTEIPDEWEGFDIGEKTIEMFAEELENAKTVIWNGPLGLFEFDQFAIGTNAIAKVLSELDATTIIGGGDSAAAVEKAGLAEKFTHISTGGGASLEFLEGKDLPGVVAANDK